MFRLRVLISFLTGMGYLASSVSNVKVFSLSRMDWLQKFIKFFKCTEMSSLTILLSVTLIWFVRTVKLPAFLLMAIIRLNWDYRALISCVSLGVVVSLESFKLCFESFSLPVKLIFLFLLNWWGTLFNFKWNVFSIGCLFYLSLSIELIIESAWPILVDWIIYVFSFEDRYFNYYMNSDSYLSDNKFV